MHGCIFWSKKKDARKIVQTWHNWRKDEDIPKDSTGIVRAMEEIDKKFHEEVFLKDVAHEVGRKNSKFIPHFTWDEAYGWNTRDQIYDFIKKDKKLGKVANAAAKAEL